MSEIPVENTSLDILQIGTLASKVLHQREQRVILTTLAKDFSLATGREIVRQEEDHSLREDYQESFSCPLNIQYVPNMNFSRDTPASRDLTAQSNADLSQRTPVELTAGNGSYFLKSGQLFVMITPTRDDGGFDVLVAFEYHNLTDADRAAFKAAGRLYDGKVVRRITHQPNVESTVLEVCEVLKPTPVPDQLNQILLSEVRKYGFGYEEQRYQMTHIDRRLPTGKAVTFTGGDDIYTKFTWETHLDGDEILGGGWKVEVTRRSAEIGTTGWSGSNFISYRGQSPLTPPTEGMGTLTEIVATIKSELGIEIDKRTFETLFRRQIDEVEFLRLMEDGPRQVKFEIAYELFRKEEAASARLGVEAPNPQLQYVALSTRTIDSSETNEYRSSLIREIADLRSDRDRLIREIEDLRGDWPGTGSGHLTRRDTVRNTTAQRSFTRHVDE